MDVVDAVQSGRSRGGEVVVDLLGDVFRGVVVVGVGPPEAPREAREDMPPRTPFPGLPVMRRTPAFRCQAGSPSEESVLPRSPHKNALALG